MGFGVAGGSGGYEAGNGRSTWGPPRHCWVRDLPDVPGRWPGVLMEWRRAGAGWQGRVVLVAETAEGPALLERWVDPDHLDPVEGG